MRRALSSWSMAVVTLLAAGCSTGSPASPMAPLVEPGDAANDTTLSTDAGETADASDAGAVDAAEAGDATGTGDASHDGGDAGVDGATDSGLADHAEPGDVAVVGHKDAAAD